MSTVTKPLAGLQCFNILWKCLLESDSQNARKRNKNILHFDFSLTLKKCIASGCYCL